MRFGWVVGVGVFGSPCCTCSNQQAGKEGLKRREPSLRGCGVGFLGWIQKHAGSNVVMPSCKAVLSLLNAQLLYCLSSWQNRTRKLHNFPVFFFFLGTCWEFANGFSQVSSNAGKWSCSGSFTPVRGMSELSVLCRGVYCLSHGPCRRWVSSVSPD